MKALPDTMTATADLLLSMHIVVLLAFITVTALLMLVTVMNRMRVRPVQMSWRNGKLYGLPTWPAIFAILVFGLLAGAVIRGHDIDMTVMSGYVVGATCWFAASVLSTTVLVTDFGLILNVNNARKALSWGQVVDYFEFTRGKQHGFVFFYVGPNGNRRRMEVIVSPRYLPRFREIISEKLDTRFECAVKQVYGKQALEG